METNRQIALRALTGAFINRDPNVVNISQLIISANPTIPMVRSSIKDLIPRLPRLFYINPACGGRGDLVMVHGLCWMGTKAMIVVDFRN